MKCLSLCVNNLIIMLLISKAYHSISVIEKSKGQKLLHVRKDSRVSENSKSLSKPNNQVKYLSSTGPIGKLNLTTNLPSIELLNQLVKQLGDSSTATCGRISTQCSQLNASELIRNNYIHMLMKMKEDVLRIQAKEIKSEFIVNVIADLITQCFYFHVQQDLRLKFKKTMKFLSDERNLSLVEKQVDSLLRFIHKKSIRKYDKLRNLTIGDLANETLERLNANLNDADEVLKMSNKLKSEEKFFFMKYRQTQDASRNCNLGKSKYCQEKKELRRLLLRKGETIKNLFDFSCRSLRTICVKLEKNCNAAHNVCRRYEIINDRFVELEKIETAFQFGNKLACIINQANQEE